MRNSAFVTDDISPCTSDGGQRTARLTRGFAATLFFLSIATRLILAGDSAALASTIDSVRTSWRSGDEVVQSTIPAGAIQLRAVAGGNVLASTLALPDDAPRQLIVQFDAPPTLEARRRNLDPGASRAPYRRFLADQAGLEAAASAKSGGRAEAIRVRRRFEATFNGMAITATPVVADQLRALPYVAAVYADDPVHTVLSHSVGQIQADRLRTTSGASGDGIVVSIVDTGIDYGHPALGGCIGASCRIIDGYDFVNGDADPQDDHGHGTHVAGIVGGNGSGITGVAPAARFLAYKVLGAAGTGTVSDVIAGIERSLDPDQDPLTDDAADVINLSIGGPGDAEGPLAQAIDQAVAAGVVVVAAAGNSGGYLTIGSAGSARRAITVGAVDQADRIAAFSSRGPSAPDEAIKPDVVAPGVGIVSAWPGGGTRSQSGTSMAAPHVAGVAALMLELRPEWPPAALKAALMNSATDIGVDPFQQGAGRIDALAASRAGLALEPANLSFGLSPMTATLWSASHVITVRNDATRARTVAFSVTSDLPGGSSLTIAPASMQLGAGESRNIEATLTLDRAPEVRQAPYAYTGVVSASFDDGALRLPFAVLRSPQLVVRVDGQGLVVVHNGQGYNQTFVVSGPGSTPLFLPSGTYDAMAFLGYDGRIVQEGIAVSGSHTVDLFQANTVHSLRRVTIDEQGRSISTPIGIESILHRETGVGLVSFGGISSTSRFSDVTPDYDVEWHRLSYGQEPKTYDFQGMQRGISASSVVQNEPGDLRHLTLAYHPQPDVQKLIPVRWVSNGPRGVPFGNGFAVSLITNMAPLAPLEPPFTQEVYYMPVADPDLHYKSRVFAAHPYVGQPFPTGVPEIETPYLIADQAQPIRGYLYGDETEPVVSLAQDRLEIGYGPPTWIGSFNNSAGTLRMLPRIGRRGWLFLNQQGGWRDHSQLPFTLARAGGPIEDGTLTGGLTRALVPGTHTLTIVNDRHWIAGEAGRAEVVAEFNSLAADPNPPHLGDLRILVNGVPADFAGAGESAIVRFTAGDAVALSTVELATRAAESAAWKPLLATQVGNQFAAALPRDPGRTLSLRIEATDASGNRLTYSMEPAFRWGGSADVEAPRVTLLAPNGGERWLPASTQSITWNATDNRAVSSVDLNYSTDGGTTYPHVIAAGIANDGTFAWTLPSAPNSTMRVRASAYDEAGHMTQDASDADFALAEPPVVIDTFARRVSDDDDDAEERSGRVSLSSSDLELIEDRRTQIVGIRFRDVQIPQGATIVSASIQFQADESHSGPTDLVIHGELSPHAADYASGDKITDRSPTRAAVAWDDVPPWTRGDRGAAQKTPDVKAIVQEIVAQGGWRSGRALAVIVSGAGKRVAESHDGQPSGAAELVVEYSAAGSTGPTNQPPRVDAGPGRTISAPPASIGLAGTASDDGLPQPANLTTSWSATGPAGVNFDDARLMHTRATFTSPGVYVLKFEANDGAAAAADTLTVHVVEPSGAVATLDRRVSHDDDDGEEDTRGRMDLSSSDLELVEESTEQVIGMRFRNITIPRGAVITAAHLQFQADEEDDVATALDIMAEASDDAPGFTEDRGNISNRPRTASVRWTSVPAWNIRGEQGARQKTRNIGTVIQAIVSRGGWQSGNAIVVIIDGRGKRVAESHDGKPGAAPLLHIEYEAPGAAAANEPPRLEPIAATIETRAVVAPNPMRGSGTLRLSLARAGVVRMRVFDIQGRQVSPALTRSVGAGEHVFTLGSQPGWRLGPGLYFYRLDAPDAVLSGRFMVIE